MTRVVFTKKGVQLNGGEIYSVKTMKMESMPNVDIPYIIVQVPYIGLKIPLNLGN
jgi:hypothetical protein